MSSAIASQSHFLMKVQVDCQTCGSFQLSLCLVPQLIHLVVLSFSDAPEKPIATQFRTGIFWFVNSFWCQKRLGLGPQTAYSAFKTVESNLSQERISRGFSQLHWSVEDKLWWSRYFHRGLLRISEFCFQHSATSVHWADMIPLLAVRSWEI